MENNNELYTYIEVKSYKDGEVVKRLDVSGRSQKSIDTIENGLKRNMNHDNYYTFCFESETKKEII